MKYITPYITAHTSGFLSNKNTGLGNVLFQIASCYGIAKEHNINIQFNNVHHYCNILFQRFNYNHKDTILRNIHTIADHSIQFNNIIYENSTSSRKYSEELLSTIIHAQENIMIHGYLESILYFAKYKDDICTMFSIDNESYKIIMQKYGEILNSSTYTPISIHFRGNEYITNSSYDYAYYNRAIDYICMTTNNPYFLIFTDDPNSINLQQLSMKNYIFITHSYDYLELWTMSLCKHHIISISTFSWWGAYLNTNSDRVVLYNKELQSLYSEFYSIYTAI
jgi:hypothetical protein